MAPPTGISQLPAELLIQIFTNLDDLDKAETHITISQVCTFWRNIIFQTPLLRNYRYVSFAFRGTDAQRIPFHSLFDYNHVLRCTVRNGEIVKYTHVYRGTTNLSIYIPKRARNDQDIPLDCMILDEGCFGDKAMLKHGRRDHSDKRLAILDAGSKFVFGVQHGTDGYSFVMMTNEEFGSFMREGALNSGSRVRDVVEGFARTVEGALMGKGYDTRREFFFLKYGWVFIILNHHLIVG
ncbi:hypothetical protein AA313_de0205206 [Arthrobotrys entomopaga]|nr:hypothetical protein AA313_de0205206 [Arthrobotrys entomopaga]